MNYQVPARQVASPEPPQTPTTKIIGETIRLQDSIEIIHQAIDALVNRLDKVLTPQPPTKPESEKHPTDEVSSQLAVTIRTSADLAQLAVRRINLILTSLEL